MCKFSDFTLLSLLTSDRGLVTGKKKKRKHEVSESDTTGAISYEKLGKLPAQTIVKTIF